jgi:hypothetical protein
VSKNNACLSMTGSACLDPTSARRGDTSPIGMC